MIDFSLAQHLIGTLVMANRFEVLQVDATGTEFDLLIRCRHKSVAEREFHLGMYDRYGEKRVFVGYSAFGEGLDTNSGQFVYMIGLTERQIMLQVNEIMHQFISQAIEKEITSVLRESGTFDTK